VEGLPTYDGLTVMVISLWAIRQRIEADKQVVDQHRQVTPS
jgi:hypothetical protein